MTNRESLEYALYQAGSHVSDLRRFVPAMTENDARDLRAIAGDLVEMADRVGWTERSA